MSYHFLCKRGIRPARTEQFLVYFLFLNFFFLHEKQPVCDCDEDEGENDDDDNDDDDIRINAICGT